MRKLAWAALSFAAAIFLAEYLLPVEGLPYIAAALAFFGTAGLFLRGNGRRRVMLALFGAALGFLWFWGRWQLSAVPAQAVSGLEATVTARVTDYPEASLYGVKVQVRLTGEETPRVGAILYLDEEPAQELKPGDIITVTVKLRYADRVAGEESLYYRAHDIYLLGTNSTPAVVTGRSGMAWVYFPKTICKAIKDSCDRIFPDDVASLVKALMTGDKTDLRNDNQAYSDMRCSGMLHAVAVSGLHMFYVIAFLQLLFGKSRKTSLLCLPLMLLFVLMTGASASVVRAAVMQALLLLAPLFGRESDSITSLSAAMALLLLINPAAAGDVGLQLSFACEAGLVFLLPGMSEWCRRKLPTENSLVRFIADSLCCSAAAMAFSLPLCAVYFETITLLSWLANLLTLFVLEILFCAGYLLCGLGLVLPGFAAALAWCVAWLARYCMTVYHVIASIPYACLYTQNGLSGWWLTLVYVLLGAAWLLRKKAGGLRLVLPVSLSVVTLCLLIVTQGARYRDQDGAVAVLNVGQGQSVVLMSADAAVVVDCGGSSATGAGDEAADCLMNYGYSRVDLLILTHFHADHVNGVMELMSRMSVERLAYPADADEDGTLSAQILAAAEQSAVELYAIERLSQAQVGDMTLTLYVPEAGTNVNERGIIVRASLYGGQALIMGDAGASAELALIAAGGAEPAELLIAGHHGSKTSSTMLFLTYVAPETAVISVGYNSYGHPSSEVLERLEIFCSEVYRTDLEGTVTVPMGVN